MPMITFHLEEDEEDVRVEAELWENLMDVARRGRIPLDAPCAGNGSCGKCRVQVLDGAIQGSRSFYVSDVEYDEGWRLACTSRVSGT